MGTKLAARLYLRPNSLKIGRIRPGRSLKVRIREPEPAQTVILVLLRMARKAAELIRALRGHSRHQKYAHGDL